MIEVNGLVKRFDGFAALDGAALSVPAGSVYGLVGPNGAGKSTLIRHLTGIFRQDAGTVRIGGEDVWENAALKARIAAIPDDWYYFLQSSIRDMMRFYRGFYPAFSMERYEKLKEVFQLDEKRPIRRLSKGMQKQAAFWLALCCMPDYLILDEPVDGLDPVMRRQVWSLVLGGCGPARHHGAGFFPQPAGAGGRLRPRGHHGPRPRAAGAVPGPAAGQHGKAAGGVPRRDDGGAVGPAGAPRQPNRPACIPSSCG